MHSFRRQPLTWLFLIATACLDVVALVAWREVIWYDVLLVGQAMVVAGWAVLGKSHRLARCAGIVIAVLLTTAPDYYREPLHSILDYRPIGTWKHVMGAYLFLIAATVGFAGLVSIATRSWPSSGAAEHPKWQIPLAEIFGWMIVVAVGAATLPHARFDALLNARHYPSWVATWFGAPALAGTAMGVLLPVSEFHLKSRRRIAAFLITIFIIALLIAGVESRSYIAAATAYVGLWIAVQWLDERSASRIGVDSAPT